MIPTPSSDQDVKVQVSQADQIAFPRQNSSHYTNCVKTLVYIAGFVVWTSLVVAMTKNATGC